MTLDDPRHAAPHRGGRRHFRSTRAGAAVVAAIAVAGTRCVSCSVLPVRGLSTRCAIPERIKAPGRRPAAFGAALGGFLAPVAVAQGQGTLRLRQVIAEKGLEDYRLDEYEAMRDDEPRTSKYEAAIRRRLAGSKDSQTAVDIGTGPFALLAVIAARAGARKVYAIEKNPAVAALARKAVASAQLEQKIEVIEGDSTAVQLPERVDFVVSELIGSIAKQEGVQRIIDDASRRFLKNGAGKGAGSCPQMIPARCQTYIAPVSYAYHPLLKVKPENLRPVRLDSESKDILFLSEPALLEDFDYCSPTGSGGEEVKRFSFKLPAQASSSSAAMFSGFAMWARVVMDDVDIIEVRNTRSHWTYVVALMDTKPTLVKAPSEIRLTSRIQPLTDPVQYTFEAEVTPA